jgi:hypothetical protein
VICRGGYVSIKITSRWNSEVKTYWFSDFLLIAK